MFLVRVAENLLTIFILGGFGYIIFQSFKGNNVFSNLKEKMGRITGGKNKK